MTDYLQVALYMAEKRKEEERLEAYHKAQQEIIKNKTFKEIHSIMKCGMKRFDGFQGISFKEGLNGEFNEVLSLHKDEKQIVKVHWNWWEISTKPVIYITEGLIGRHFHNTDEAMIEVAAVVSKYL